MSPQKQEGRHFPEICMKIFSDICMKYLNAQEVRIKKILNKHTVDYHAIPSELTSRIHPLTFLWTPKGFIFSPECFLNFFKPVFHTMIAEKFQIHGVKITGKCICESKSWICSFLLMFRSKNLSQVLIITFAGRRKSTISPKQCFFTFPQQKRRRIMELKKWPKLNLQGHWSQVLINAISFLQLLHFGFCFVMCDNVDWSMLNCEGSST